MTSLWMQTAPPIPRDTAPRGRLTGKATQKTDSQNARFRALRGVLLHRRKQASIWASTCPSKHRF